MLDTPPPFIGPVFIDCGAHSVHTGYWKELPIDDYLAFLSHNHTRFSYIAAPDVVGDTQETLNNFKYFMKRIDFPAKKVLSVYHLQAREMNRLDEVLDYSQEAGLEWLGIGGALGVGFTDTQKLIALEYVYSRLQARGNPFKVHLFGIPNPLTIKLFKPDSVDSANFIYCAKTLRFQEFNHDKWMVDKKQFDFKQMARSQMTDIVTKLLLKHSETTLKLDPRADDYGYVYDQTEKIADSMKFIAINGLNLVAFEKHVCDTLNYKFKHHITYPLGMARRYAGLYNSILGYIWKDRALIGYPQLHGMSSHGREKELSSFGTLPQV